MGMLRKENGHSVDDETDTKKNNGNGNGNGNGMSEEMGNELEKTVMVAQSRKQQIILILQKVSVIGLVSPNLKAENQVGCKSFLGNPVLVNQVRSQHLSVCLLLREQA